MKERPVNWINTLSERVLAEYPISFSPTEVQKQPDLFAHRSALFYTPSDSIPRKFKGVGPLDVKIPIVTADWTEAIEHRPPTSPRFWVDLIQRQTMKLRWTPIPKARVRFTRYDYYRIREDHFVSGIKALLDAFKEKTSGRSDGVWLYYFGAIVDDGPSFINLECDQEYVDHPGDAYTRIQIDPI